MIRDFADPPCQGSNSLAFAIAGSSVTGDKRQRHVALLFRHRTGDLRLLHLGWHHSLRYEPWLAADYRWCELAALDPLVQESFLDWVEMIAVAGNDGTSPIPYSAIFRPDGNFDSRGHFVDRQDGTGLTCATFILAAFADFEMPIVDPLMWPRRPEDLTWFDRILAKLRRFLTEVEFVQQLQRRHELRRFRPEEVFAAGGIFAGDILSFEAVSEQLARIEGALPH